MQLILQANWALSQGLKAGDVVALMMSNRPEFIVSWLAFAKIGVITAFLNFNLRGTSLLPETGFIHVFTGVCAPYVLCCAQERR